MAILAGGVLGALARWWLAAHLLPEARFPFGTLVINSSGCFLLGFLFTFLLDAQARPSLRLGATTGFLGAYTTFSTWQEGVAVLWRGGAPASALVYLAGTLVAGVVLAGAGMALAGRVTSGRGTVGAGYHPGASALPPSTAATSVHAGPARQDGGGDINGAGGKRAAGEA